eukprot:TRINITY_DN67507_c7_g5_i1.p1 TRINITY_DN67507_c7_g5~~TRINITY_DN67507_c7_g5_i1.p1  ORF type:complete len:1090 (-),score=172.10 TRINITY_DN67507_c7_g5_i1:1283-4510(-)
MSAQELESALRNLASCDNNIRKQAEQWFTQATNQNGSAVATTLVQLANSSQDRTIQQMCYVLLRRQLMKITELSKFPPEAIAMLNTTFLNELGKQPVGLLRKSHAHCLVALAIPYLDHLKDWPELCPRLDQMVKTGTPEQKEAALLVLSNFAPHYDENFLTQALGPLKDTFAAALAESEPVSVRVAAADAIMNTVAYLEENQLNVFVELLPQLVAALGAAISSGDNESAVRGLEAFISVASVSPQFFKKYMKDVLAPFLQLAPQENSDERLRRGALEFCLTCAETNKRIVKKTQGFLQALVPLSLRMMASIEEDSDWNTTSPEEDDEELDFEIGQTALDRLAIALGGKSVFPVILPMLQQALGADSWQQRVVGLIALGAIAEGCCDELLAENPQTKQRLLDEVVPGISNHIEHPHVRVRGAAVQCFAQFCSDFGTDFTGKHHEVLASRLVQAMKDQVPRLNALGVRGVRDFLNNADAEHYEPYLDTIMTSLLQLLQNAQHRFVIEDVVQTISTVASVSEGKFEKYYSTIMPWLKNVAARQVTCRLDRVLRSHVIRCLSQTVMAVGKDTFSPDAREVLEIFQRLQGENLVSDDPLAGELGRSWGRLAAVMKEDFVPFIQLVVPPLVERFIDESKDMSVSEATGEEEDEEGVERIAMNIKGLANLNICINTSAVEEKADACETLRIILDAVKDAMLPFFEKLLLGLVKGLKYPYNDTIREDSAMILSVIAKVVAEKCPDKLASVLNGTIPILLANVSMEPNPEVLVQDLSSLAEIMRSAPAGGLPKEIVGQVSDAVKTKITHSMKERAKLKRQQQSNDDEDDDEASDEADEVVEAEETLNQLVDVLSALVERSDSAEFLDHFENVFLPSFVDYVNPTNDRVGDFERRLGLCMIASYMKGRGEQSRHANDLVKAMIQYILVDYQGDIDLIQAACYALGAAAQYCPAVFQQSAQEALTRLVAVATQKKADEDWDACVCNAVWALQQAQQFHSGPCHDPSVTNAILGALPVTGDEEQAQIVHKRVLEQVEQRNAVVLGQNNAHLSGIVNVFQQLTTDKSKLDLLDSAGKEKAGQLIRSCQ